VTLFSDFVEKALPATVLKEGVPPEYIFQVVAVVVTAFAIFIGYEIYHRNKAVIEKWRQSPTLMTVRNFFFQGWGFDYLYDVVFVKPFLFITRVNKSDIFDKFYNGIAKASQALNRFLSVTQNGSLRWYIAGALIGILFIFTLQLLL